MKWLSQEPTRVLEDPRFVSLEEIMRKGVQVYIPESPAFIETLVKGRKQHPLLIQEGLESGTLSSLNEAYHIPRLQIPPPDANPDYPKPKGPGAENPLNLG